MRCARRQLLRYILLVAVALESGSMCTLTQAFLGTERSPHRESQGQSDVQIDRCTDNQGVAEPIGRRKLMLEDARL
jgi:hypothetical protein